MVDLNETQIFGPSRAPQIVPDAVLVCLGPESARARTPLIELSGDAVVLGRGAGSDAVVDAPGVADAHARFSAQSGAWAVEVIAGADPVTVNRSPVTRAFLKAGDTIGIGEARYAFRPAGGAAEDDDDEAPTEFNRTLVMDPATAQKLSPARPREPAPPSPGPAPSSGGAVRRTPDQERASRGRWPLVVAAVAAALAVAAAAVYLGLRP